ncbi:uncharacterized protein LOC128963629 [Oppia nitens]|uniref:uncharacterized protein LOC128963629 n=1 Tax=Oppia nitens TaxID=1686743 RepID=UPI0023DA5BA6|nr:uncharacterized protein LOC128963629 [Oppia nitens]
MLNLAYLFPHHMYIHTNLQFPRVQFNFLSIGVLLLAIISGYYEKWFSYEWFSLLSLSIIICLTLHKYQTRVDLFNEVVVKEMYLFQIQSYNPNQNCHFKSNCFEMINFHRNHKCCGWLSPNDYMQSNWHLKHNNTYLLPQYCCNYWRIRHMHNNCTIDSEAKYEIGCHLAMANEYETFNPISYKYGIAYPVIKAISIILFAITKMSSLLPSAEGIFSESILR